MQNYHKKDLKWLETDEKQPQRQTQHQKKCTQPQRDAIPQHNNKEEQNDHNERHNGCQHIVSFILSDKL